MKKLLLASTFIVAFDVSEAKADPISSAILATIGSVSTAGGIGAFAFLGVQGWAGVALSVVARAGIGFALASLSQQAGGAGSRYEGNAVSATAPRAIIYGNPKVGGAVFYRTKTGTNNRYLHYFIAFAGHECDSFQSLFLDGVKVTLDANGFVTSPSKYNNGTDYYIRITTHLGADDQSADADAVSEIPEWTDAHKVSGVCYAHIRYERVPSGDPENTYEGGIPELTARIRGKKLYDPRDSSNVWSKNNALCIRDYLTNDRYGLGIDASKIDDDLFISAADICDENITTDDNPEGGLTADYVYANGDTISNGHVDGSNSLFWACDCIISSSDSGLIWEKGANTNGAFFGTNGESLIFAVGGNTTDQLAYISVSFDDEELRQYLGQPVRFMGEIDNSTSSIKLWLYSEPDELLHEFTMGGGQETADTAWADWSHPNSGSVGGSSNAVFGNYDETDYTNVINELRFYDAQTAPTFTTTNRDRYNCVGSFLSDANPRDILQHMTASMGGYIWESAGKWGCKAAKWDDTGLSFTEDDMRGPIEVNTANSMRESFNTVTGTYIGPQTEYEQGDYTPVTYEDYRDQDGGLERATDLPLYFTDREEAARRLARIKIKQMRQPLTVTVPMGLKALELTVGDVITLNSITYGGPANDIGPYDGDHHFGLWGGNKFEVMDWRLVLADPIDNGSPKIEIRVILRQTSENVYNNTVAI